MSRIGARTGRICLIWRSAGSRRFTAATMRLTKRWPRVGWSNDCICTSSSLTTPPVPSEIIGETTVARSLVADNEPSMPPRRIAIASISSMKPIAPPSRRAASRSAAKYARILRAVAP